MYLLPYLRFKKTLLNSVYVMYIQETKTFVEFQAIKSSFPVPYNITCQVRLIKRHIRFFSKSHFGI